MSTTPIVWNKAKLDEVWSRIGRIDTTASAAAAAAASNVTLFIGNYASYGAVPAASSNQGKFATVTTANTFTFYFSGEKTGTGNGYEWIPLYHYDGS